MAKKLLLQEEAREKLLSGAKKIYDVVSSTLGPKSYNVVIELPYGAPIIVKDGITAAKEVDLEDGFENLAAGLLIQSSDTTNKAVGDGSTTSIVLAYEIFKRGLKEIANGENGMIFKEQLKEASEKVISELKKYSKEVKTKEEMTNVATISSANAVLGDLVATAFEKVTSDGVVTADVGSSKETELEFKDGLTLQSGWLFPLFVTDAQTMKTELTEPYVLVTDKDLTGVEELFGILKKVYDSGNKEVLVVANNFTGLALTTLAQNQEKQILKLLPVKAPRGGDLKEGILDDLATATGATFISSKLGLDIKSIELEHLGRASKVVADRNETVIIGGKGDPKKIKNRVEQLRKQLGDAESEYEKEKYQTRLSRLSGGIAIIYAGGSSEAEIREKKLRVEDAINATRAAISEGVIPGGGVALYHAREVLKDKKTIGERILYDALSKPLEKLLENSGADKSKIEYQLTRPELVYDVTNGFIVNAFTSGIVDPLQVTRMALENAISVASLMLTSGAAITNIKEESKKSV